MNERKLDDYFKDAKPFEFPIELVREEIPKEEPKSIIPCPVCRSNEIGEVTGNNGILGPGYHSWVKYEYCKNCGIHLHPDRRVFSPNPSDL